MSEPGRGDEDGPVTPRELYEQLKEVYDRISRMEKVLIVLAILAGPKFFSSAIDVFTSTAQAMGLH